VLSNHPRRRVGVILAAAHEIGVLRAMCRLRIEEYRVLAACDGEQALDIFCYLGGEIDLALIDLAIPPIGGIELISKILAVKPDTNVVLVHENRGQSLSGIGTLQARALAKPFAHHNLLREVRLALSGERLVPDSIGDWEQTAAGTAGAQGGVKSFVAGK
jgi:DNA-binding NarL/FixJ family response regulator